MSEDKKYSNEDIKARMSNYGNVYLHDEIKDRIQFIIGCEEQKESMTDFFNVLNNYTTFTDKLTSSSLIPNLTMLLYGPPGTGKTSLTRAYAYEYKFNMCVVEADRLVTSLLGETIKNIRKAVENALDIARENNTPFILFFDEIDAIGSERSNVHEVGEIKRAVISFLQTIDKINYAAVPLAILGATNHQQQLDSAIWRRFTFHLKFNFPNYELRAAILNSFIFRIIDVGIQVGIEKSKIAGYDQTPKEKKRKYMKENNSITMSMKNEIVKIDIIADEHEDFKGVELMEEVKKRGEENIITLTHGYSGSDLERGVRVALFKVIGSNKKVLTYDLLYKSLKLVGGTASHVDRQEELSSSTNQSNEQETNDRLKQIKDKDGFLMSLPFIIENLERIISEKDIGFIKNSLKSGNSEYEFIKTIKKLDKFRDNMRNEIN